VEAKITGKNRQELMGDKILRNEKLEYFFVDEKAASYLHERMVVELIQDIKTEDLGWFFKLKLCDRLIYSYYDGDDAELLSTIYNVKFSKLKEYIVNAMAQNDSNIKYGNTDRNFGLTHNIYYPWEILIAKKIAKIVWPKTEG